MPDASDPTLQPEPVPAPTGDALDGRVVRITYRNPENGYVVARVEPEGVRLPAGVLDAQGLATVVGVMPGIEVGLSIHVEGEWITDARFGRQLRARSFRPCLPTSRGGIEAYLASGVIKGIGPKTARRIVEHFGEQTLAILDHAPQRLAEVPGIPRRTAARLREAWRAAATHDRDLLVFLGEHGISPVVAARLRKAYGENALAVVRADPYRLMSEVHGIGFARADAIARKLGLALDAPERIDAALLHALESAADDGHTCLPRERLLEAAAKLLGTAADVPAARLDAALAAGRLAAEPGEDPKQGPWIFLPALRDAERRIAERIGLLMRAPKMLPAVDAVAVLADFEQRTRLTLAPAQREAVLTLARRGMAILTGGPGTGKTTAVRAVIELFAAGRRTVRLAAPTGRAARRLAESGRLPAETIHRLLGYQAPLGRFTRDAQHPVDADLVIVDEASMLDAPLAARLLEALAPRTCLLLVGDEDQLPSVGPGNVLGDLIAAAAMPVVRLTEIFRQARHSLIVVNAHRINQGLMPLADPEEPGGERDFFLIERDEPEAIVAAIRTLVRERIPRKFHLDPHHDVQVLTPMRRGDLGVERLNRELKELLNPAPAASTGGRPPFDPGDRVMQLTNNYDKLVFNGDIGTVIHAHPDTRETLVDFDGRAVSYLRDELEQLVLAYATTIHKSQGSEYPAVIIPLHSQHWIMLQRNLLYTAVTRARRLVCVVGPRRALARAVRNARRAARYTGLRRFLAADVAADSG